MGANYNQIDWYTNFTIVLSAGESRKISKYGKYITILTNSSSTDPRLQINGQQGGQIPAGLSLELPALENFDRLELKNEGGTSMTLEVAVSNGKIIDSRTVLSGAVEVKNDPLNTPLDVSNVSTVIDTVADVTLTAATGTQIVAANTARRTVIITNDTGADIRIGDSAVGAADGVRLIPDASITLDTRAAVYGYSVGGGTVSILELED